MGGQYNFVAMAHELPDARSIMTLRSTRQDGADTVSNILFNYGHCTIPRHLRDIVITEYGIADLRGKDDQEVYRQMIGIADARFQDELAEQAKSAGKLPGDFRIPGRWRDNTPEKIRQTAVYAGELFPEFPFGSDFTDEEHRLSAALQWLQSATATRSGKAMTVVRALMAGAGDGGHDGLLRRMALDAPTGVNEHLQQRLLRYALARHCGSAR